jgi:formylglycine-generating enzyme required for sulfatase activity
VFSPLLDDRPAVQDALEFAPYCDTLIAILRDNATRTPLTLGLFGSWGSGKTSLMRMLEAGIQRARVPGFHTTWFNAWKYNREEVLWRALLLQVLDALRPSAAELAANETDRTLADRAADLDRLEESLYRTVEWEELGRWTLDWARALRGTAEDAAEIALSFVPGSKPLIALLKQITEAVAGKKDASLAEAFHREVTRQRREQLRSLEQFERSFQEVLDRHIVQPSGRLIVFVDDLDRCLPDKAIEVLEAINLFLDVPGCIFVLGLDQEAIIDTIQTRYQGRLKAREYLEKLIQIPFQLPPIEDRNMRGFVDALVPHFPDARCSEVFTKGLPRSPRQVKRTINMFLLMWRLSRLQLPESIEPVRLAKVVVIQHNCPTLYGLLREVPGLLRDLELYYRETDDERPPANAASRPTPPAALPPVEEATVRRLANLFPASEAQVNFGDLTPQAIRPYIYLTYRATAQLEAKAEAPAAPAVAQPQLVRVPAGKFSMGMNEASDEKPIHEVDLPDFEIGRYPVSNFEYQAFVRESDRLPPSHWTGAQYPENLGDHPVVYVRWPDAVAYCNWLSRKTGQSYRLPTEAEWEKAARGAQGHTWPWGNDWSAAKCNSKEAQRRTTTPTSQFSPDGDSVYGAADMAGNVWEWCSSLYRPYPYRANDGREDSQANGERVVRGGSFADNRESVRGASRHRRLPNIRDNATGFRVVRETPPT